MPEISVFYGIRITMYYRDHQPPHFHAEYGDDEELIVISTLATYAGSPLGPRPGAAAPQ
jgi:hypothetical protein